MVALDIGHTRVIAAIGDSRGNLVASERREMDVDVDSTAALDVAARLISAVSTMAGSPVIAKCVAAFALPIEAESGRVRASVGLSAWDGIAPGDEIFKRTGIPTHVENDALLGALGEIGAGVAAGKRDVLYLKVSHGIGAGLVLGGRPYRGANGLAGDIGHIKVAGRSELCRCGERGCLEATISLTSIADQIAATHHGAEVPFGAHDAIDAVTSRILQDAGRELGAVVAQVANLLNPECVVIGGTMATAHATFFEGIQWAVREYARPTIAARTEVRLAALDGLSTLHGALLIAARTVVAAR
ncbi:ROK family protein [Demequina soli]|uniref:ROK family protein n=1 Tax=Demequina soli TaxID=1638987 RepID=UPI001E4C8E07|nr:ROK family protein [Demequina soli]